MIKATGHQNAYFPMMIPKSYLAAEADHVDWFAKECAVVTHYRLRNAEDGWVEVDPDAKLEEELVLRPTSETMIWKTYKQWIQSYRDLPIMINQRANVVRREMRTRLFLRTSEFLWQEWHTAHATKQEAIDEAYTMHEVYRDLMQNRLAMAWVPWQKSESERFAGAEDTLTIESMMKDTKALQSNTSHFLGQNFAKAFDVTYTNQDNQDEHVWASSRWLSTRIVWWLIMAHWDDRGLVLPPAVAPIQVIIVPIAKNTDDLKAITDYLKPVLEKLWSAEFTTTGKFITSTDPIRYQIDDDLDKSPGWKFAQREMQWVPVRVVVWKKDIEAHTVEITRRDTGEKISCALGKAGSMIVDLLPTIQDALLQNHKQFHTDNTHQADSRDEFVEKVQEWFVLAHRDGTAQTEQQIQEKTKATIRCIPFDQPEQEGKCILTWNPSTQRVLFAKAY